MKRLFHGRRSELITSVVVLMLYGAVFALMMSLLPHRPRARMQLDHDLYQLVFSSEGKWLAVTQVSKDKKGGDRYRLGLWDSETGTCRRTLIDDSTIDPRAAFSPDGNRLAAYDDKNDFTIWDVRTGQLLDTFPDIVKSPQFSPDGRFLLGLSSWTLGDFPSDITFVDLATQGRAEHNVGFRLINGSPVPFAPDGKRFLLIGNSSDEFVVQIWQLLEGPKLQMLRERRFHRNLYFAWAISSDLMTLATVTRPDCFSQNRVQLWDLEKGLEITSQLYHDEQAIVVDHDFTHLEFSRDGRHLAGYYWRKGTDSSLTTVLWDANADLDIVRILPFDGYFSPCGRWLLHRGLTSADVWDVSRRKKHASIWHAGDTQNTINGSVWDSRPVLQGRFGFSPDGRFLFASGLNTTRTIGPVEAVLAGSWSKYNTTETYAVGRLWDVERGEEIASFRDCRRGVFSPDGRTLATVDGRNRVEIWTVPPRRPLGLILALTTVTWGLFLLACWWAKRWVRRRRTRLSG
jgi:WD40 repeat protein